MKINIFGDFVVSGRLKEVLSMGSTNTVLREDILNYLYSSDYNIVNLESPITRNGIPIDKLGPNLKSSPEILHLIKLGRINICTLANNHIMDFGQEGLSQTLRLLKENDISYVGVGDNIENAAKPLILEGEKGNIGIINIAEHEFNLAAPNKSGANPLNPIQNYYQIKELQDKVDKIILIVHGGHEHYEYPSPRMQDTYRFFIDSGVDVVVGHHPHCYSGYENYNGGMIFYSLGNFIFDEEGVKNEKWNYGFILSLKIERGAIDFEVIPYNQCSKKPVVYKLEGKERRQFKSKMAEINEIIQNPKNLQTRYKAYCEHRMKSLSTLFEPYENRYLKGLNARRIIPTLISKEKYIRLYNYLLCQAHRDLVDYKLESEIQN